MLLPFTCRNRTHVLRSAGPYGCSPLFCYGYSRVILQEQSGYLATGRGVSGGMHPFLLGSLTVGVSCLCDLLRHASRTFGIGFLCLCVLVVVRAGMAFAAAPSRRSSRVQEYVIGVAKCFLWFSVHAYMLSCVWCVFRCFLMLFVHFVQIHSP